MCPMPWRPSRRRTAGPAQAESGVHWHEHRVAAPSAGVPDGVDPDASHCYEDRRLVDKTAVMLNGVQVGALELLYSAHCGIVVPPRGGCAGATAVAYAVGYRPVTVLVACQAVGG